MPKQRGCWVLGDGIVSDGIGFTPWAVLFSVPFGLMGAFVFAYLGSLLHLPGMDNNIYLQTGVIMLIGLLSKTAILITEFASEYHTSSANQRMFDNRYLRIGVPAQMLEQRPDIRMANAAMEEAFYNTQAARAAFFPSITLTAQGGWTNSAGGMVIDPAKVFLNLVGSLTQPIFAQGKIKANYKINQLTEENLQKKYVQTVIDAGNQVNEAMADCEAAREKHAFYHRQVEVLHEAYTGTHELMDNGKASYLEVLTAQENLLSAQLSEASNMYKGAQAIIALYIALGGGTK